MRDPPVNISSNFFTSVKYPIERALNIADLHLLSTKNCSMKKLRSDIPSTPSLMNYVYHWNRVYPPVLKNLFFKNPLRVSLFNLDKKKFRTRISKIDAPREAFEFF